MFVQLLEFHGWTAGALWQDVPFSLNHFRDIERLALVGGRAWERGMGVFCKLFTTATIRYFYPGDADQAKAWVREGVEKPVQPD